MLGRELYASSNIAHARNPIRTWTLASPLTRGYRWLQDTMSLELFSHCTMSSTLKSQKVIVIAIYISTDIHVDTGSQGNNLIADCIRILLRFVGVLGRLRKATIDRCRSFMQTSKPLRGLILWLLCNLVFDIPYCLFIHRVLIQGHIKVGRVVFNAVTANVLVSVFSQMSGAFIDAMLREYLAVVRVKIAGRASGIRSATFIGTGPASQWTSSAILVLACRFLNFLMILR
jgi:hypothetical protein